MKNYSTLTTRYLKQHRGRTILTLIGIIIAIAMFTCIGSIYYSGINNEIESAKNDSGNFEVVFSDINKDKVEVISNNVEIKNGGTVKEEGVLKITNNLLTDSLKNIMVKGFDKEAFDNIFRIKINEGRLPQNGSEIIVSKKFYAILKDKKINEVLKGELKSKEGSTKQCQYTVVGSYENTLASDWALSYLDIKTSENTKDYSYFVNLNKAKNKIDIAQKIAKANGAKLDGNTKLLYLLGEGPDKEKNNDLAKVFGIIVAFVILCTVVVIYNAFNISVMERIKHFGILRSIGATKSQIRHMVFKEASIMSLIAIPTGILVGFAGITITFNVFMDGFLGNFKIGFYPQVVIVAALLGVVTVFISAFFPARTASKVSPIDAIRGTMVVKGDKVKRRRGFWAKLIFRFEGQVAYKNIKRSRKRFYITCISLMISLIMFVFFSNFIDVLIESNKIATQTIYIDGLIMGEENGRQYLNDNIIKNIDGLDGIKETYKFNYGSVPYTIDKKNINSKFVDSIKLKNKLEEYKDKYIIENTTLLGYDESSLKLFNEKNKTKINYDNFKSNNEIIIYNKSQGTDKDKKGFYDSFTKYKVGDEITLPVLTKNYLGKPDVQQLKKIMDTAETLTFKVVGVVDYEVITNAIPYNGYGMIMSTESFEKLTGVSSLSAIALSFESTEYSNKHFEKLNVIADENKISYVDISKQKEQYDNIVKQIIILVYGFIGLIILISTVNIINTVTINLLVKKREYATFKAIGMTKGQFKKLVLLEGALFGIIACIIGLPISYLLTYFGIVQNNPMGPIGYTAAIWPYVAGGIGMITITLLAAMFPLRKLNDMNIVEALRIEE